jgi:tRNA(fMet)-specific endonuclease VapC
MAALYLLDTNILIYIMKHHPPTVRAKFESLPAELLAMSIITLGELYFGAEKSNAREAAFISIARLQTAIEVHPLPVTAATHYGQIRAQLQAKGQIIGNNDLWLAAHARAQGWILVTNNEREFNRVDGLKVENWLNPTPSTDYETASPSSRFFCHQLP